MIASNKEHQKKEEKPRLKREPPELIERTLPMRIPPAVIGEHGGGKGDEVQDKKDRNHPTVLLSLRQRLQKGKGILCSLSGSSAGKSVEIRGQGD